MKTLKRIIQILFVLTMGFFLGIEAMIGLFNRTDGSFRPGPSNTGSQKVETLIKAIDRKYVDNVDMDSIMDRVLPTILEELDPHSAYYPAEETQVSGRIQGGASGAKSVLHAGRYRSCKQRDTRRSVREGGSAGR